MGLWGENLQQGMKGCENKINHEYLGEIITMHVGSILWSNAPLPVQQYAENKWNFMNPI